MNFFLRSFSSYSDSRRHLSADLLGCLSLAENRVVRLTDRHEMTYSKNTKIHILIIHTKQENINLMSDFFFAQFRVFRGAGHRLPKWGEGHRMPKARCERR